MARAYPETLIEVFKILSYVEYNDKITSFQPRETPLAGKVEAMSSRPEFFAFSPRDYLPVHGPKYRQREVSTVEEDSTLPNATSSNTSHHPARLFQVPLPGICRYPMKQLSRWGWIWYEYLYDVEIQFCELYSTSLF